MDTHLMQPTRIDDGIRSWRCVAAAFCAIAGAALVAFVPPADAATTVRVTGVTVNPNRTVTVNWWLQPRTETSHTTNFSLTLDGRAIKRWTTLDDSTSWTSVRALSPGRHTVTIESYTAVWTNTYYDSLDCDVSSSDDYLWICSFLEDATGAFSVGGGAPPRTGSPRAAECVVPDVVGLRLNDARARLAASGCKLGAITQAPSSRGGGTVLQQKPLKNKRFARGATVDVVIARY